MSAHASPASWLSRRQELADGSSFGCPNVSGNNPNRPRGFWPSSLLTETTEFCDAVCADVDYTIPSPSLFGLQSDSIAASR